MATYVAKLQLHVHSFRSPHNLPAVQNMFFVNNDTLVRSNPSILAEYADAAKECGSIKQYRESWRCEIEI